MSCAAASGLVDLDDMDVLQFVIHPLAQHLICAMQVELLDGPYSAFGMTEGSEERFNLVFPKTYGSDRRKPVTARFQDFCEAFYWPLVNTLLFGVEGWEQVQPHLTAFKVNTLQISADEFYYGQDIYHFHLDHKIGRLEPKDQMQKQTMRVIFSTVPAALRRLSGGKVAAPRRAATLCMAGSLETLRCNPMPGRQAAGRTPVHCRWSPWPSGASTAQSTCAGSCGRASITKTSCTPTCRRDEAPASLEA